MTTLAELRYDKVTKLFSWLIPITYLIHIAEEYWGGEGYSAYLFRVSGVHLSPVRFLVAQALGFILVTAGILLARRFDFLVMMLVILTMTVMGNALTHIFNAAIKSSYNPGLWSSILVWFPMGVFALVRFFGAISKARYWAAIVIGIGINIVIAIVTMRGGRLI